ncbi:hypothetical protein TraAM80_00021 [Trypanosoma rangeli]|uniref:Uncharacterized protein n=1 Tax=Trypanosoma rangeli TaxID=5698 RepID=A0A3R7P526_TRYRA|nr:uncharacterized protein TraAM80_00021 [Trypanosoma rangeli]RNF12864.1 hypothetical protein TraAM80_00021 [Trypanosoma rangeli]|eukprot:RNF12864.1 hypothetical protein TraAM80_00021 [Trypanosoma rangeli]
MFALVPVRRLAGIRHHFPFIQQVQLRQVRAVCCTAIVRFDMKKYEMERRRRRELEKAGIDPDDDGDAPWIAPEEQQRLDEEEERRRAEEAERVKEMLERRAQEDIEKRKKFREFRARQLAMSRNRKEANAAVKRHDRREQRFMEEDEDAVDKTEANDTTATHVDPRDEGERAQ